MKNLLIAILTCAFSLSAFAADTTATLKTVKDEVNKAKASEERVEVEETTPEVTPENNNK